MDTVQDTNAKVENEEKPKVTPPATKTPVVKTADKPAAKTATAVGSSAGAKTTTVASEPPPDPVNTMRRRITWTAIGGFLAVCFLMTLRFFLPRTLFEPSTIFRIGYPSDFGFGVDTKFQQDYRKSVHVAGFGHARSLAAAVSTDGKQLFVKKISSF